MSWSIVQYPAEVLALSADPVREEDRELLVEAAPDLVELMTKEWGVGLALPQVGISLRAFVYCPTHQPRDSQIVLNPTWRQDEGGSFHGAEGCLSVDQGAYRCDVVRPHAIVATYTRIERWWSRRRARFVELRERHLAGWDARVFLHECDHLEGVLLGGKKLKTTTVGEGQR